MHFGISVALVMKEDWLVMEKEKQNSYRLTKVNIILMVVAIIIGMLFKYLGIAGQYGSISNILGYLTGSLIFIILTPLILSYAAWRISKKSKTAAASVFNIFTIIIILISVSTGLNKSTERAELNNEVKKLEKKLEATGALSLENFFEVIDKLPENEAEKKIVDKFKNEFIGTLEDIENHTGELTLFLQDVGIVDMESGEIESIDKRIKRTETFIKNAESLPEKYKGFGKRMQSRFSDKEKSNKMLKQIFIGMNKRLSNEDELKAVKAISKAYVNYGNILLKYFAFLKKTQGDWEYNKETERLVFKKPENQKQYDEFMSDVKKAWTNIES